MKKKTLSIFAVACLTTSALTGCIGKKDDRIQISFFHAMGAANQGYISKYIESFETLYPNVKITQTSVGDYNALQTRVNNDILANNKDIADIVQTYPDHIAGYMQANRVVELSDYINSTDDEFALKGNYDYADFITSYIDEVSNLPVEGIYGLPFNKSTEVLIYNKTALEEVNFTIPNDDAWTWDDVETAAELLKVNETYGAEGNIPFAYDSASNLFITMGRQFGGTYTVKEGGNNLSAHIKFNTDSAFKSGLEYYKSQAIAGNMSIATAFDGIKYASDAFKTQKCFMTVGSSAGVTYNLPTENAFEVGVAAIPQKAGGTKAVIQQGTNLTLIKKKNGTLSEKDIEKQNYAWLFIKHVTSIENTVHWSTQGGYLPVRYSAIETQDYKNFLANNNPDFPAYYYALAHKAADIQKDYMFFDPAFPGSSTIRNEVGTAMQAIVLNPETTVDAAIATAMGLISNV